MTRIINAFGFILSVSVLIIFFTGNSFCEAQDKVIELKFATDIPVFAPIAKNWKDWGAEIEKKSNNRVKFTFYFGNSLVKGEELRKGLLKGMREIAIFSIDHDPAANKLNSVMQLPILGIESGKVGTQGTI